MKEGNPDVSGFPCTVVQPLISETVLYKRVGLGEHQIGPLNREGHDTEHMVFSDGQGWVFPFWLFCQNNPFRLICHLTSWGSGFWSGEAHLKSSGFKRVSSGYAVYKDYSLSMVRMHFHYLWHPEKCFVFILLKTFWRNRLNISAFVLFHNPLLLTTRSQEQGTCLWEFKKVLRV